MTVLHQYCSMDIESLFFPPPDADNTAAVDTLDKQLSCGMQSLGEFCCCCRGLLPGSSLPGPPQIQAANHMPNVESEHS